MTTIGAVAQQIGLTERDGERGVLMAMVGGQVRHAYLGDALAVDIDAAGDALYHASGLFRADALQGNRGRSAENLTRVLWLPFDADLLDFLGCPPASDPDAKTQRRQLLDELGTMPQDELDTLIAALRTDLEAAFTAIGLPLHRLDYTGYGLCAYVYLDETDQPRVSDARTVHKRLVEAINAHAGERLVDPQCSDAGTRVTRIPESTNHKGVLPRLVQSLIPYTGESAPLGVNPEAPRAVGRMIPANGPGLAAADADAIVAAIRPSWAHGQRHALALAVAAMLAKAGVPEEQAAAMIAALAGGDDDEPRDRRTAVASTYRRARQGAAIAGYTQLARLLPAAAVAFVDATLDCYRQAVTSGPVSVGVFDVVGGRGKPSVEASLDESELYKRRERQVVALVSAPPEGAFYGWFANYRDAVAGTTEAADALHLGASLTVTGAMIGRRIGAQFGSDDIFPPLYTVLVGATGWSRKETAMKRALEQLSRPLPGSFTNIAPFFTTTSDITSAEGLADILERTPNTLVRLAELTLLFANMERKGTKNLPDRLINLWDTPNEFVVNRTGGRSTRAANPTLSILAATQPGRLADAMTQEHMLSGFANRMTFVTGKPKPAMAQPDSLDRIRMWDLYRSLTDAINSYPPGTMLPRAAETDRRWDDWYLREIRGTANNDEESEAMRARHQMMALKVALIYAVSDRSPEIRLCHLEPAIAFVEWMWRNLIVLMRSWGVAYWSQIERRIEDVLSERGPMKRGALGKACANRKWNIRDFGMVLDALIKNDRVGLDGSGVCWWVHEPDDGTRTNADTTRTGCGHSADNADMPKTGGVLGDLGA